MKKHEAFLCIALIIALVEIVNLLTIKANHELLRIVLDALIFLAGVTIGGKRAK